jgi:hypothetical protein
MSFLDDLAGVVGDLNTGSTPGNSATDWASYYQNYSGATLAPTLPTANSNSGDWLSNLFAKQPGGTLLGNIIRSAASGATGGILGQGKNMINSNGTVGNGDNSSAISDVLASLGYVASKTPQGQQIISQSAGTYLGAQARTNSTWLVVVGLLGLVVVYLLAKKK